MSKYASNKPENAVIVSRYDRLSEKIALFAQGKYPFVILVGKSGKGKTEIVKAGMEQAGLDIHDHEKGYGYHRGRLSGLDFYKWLYKFRDRPIVIDDTPDMWRERHIPALTQAVCETVNEARYVCWRTSHPDIGFGENSRGEARTPPDFYTTSPVLIITNDWSSANETIRSVENRATQSIVFAPSHEDTHFIYVPTWFDTSSPVYSFIGEYLDVMPNLHCRYYFHGGKMRVNEPDYWQEDLLSMMLPESARSVIIFRKLNKDDRFDADVDRIREFTRLGAGSPATWKRIKSELGLSRKNRVVKTPVPKPESDTLSLSGDLGPEQAQGMDAAMSMEIAFGQAVHGKQSPAQNTESKDQSISEVEVAGA